MWRREKQRQALVDDTAIGSAEGHQRRLPRHQRTAAQGFHQSVQVRA
jgi:hypothetical protein